VAAFHEPVLAPRVASLAGLVVEQPAPAGAAA
jgi:hypothetical protein